MQQRRFPRIELARIDWWAASANGSVQYDRSRDPHWRLTTAKRLEATRKPVGFKRAERDMIERDDGSSGTLCIGDQSRAGVSECKTSRSQVLQITILELCDTKPRVCLGFPRAAIRMCRIAGMTCENLGRRRFVESAGASAQLGQRPSLL